MPSVAFGLLRAPIDTWAWGCPVPVLSELSCAYEVCNLIIPFAKQDKLIDILKLFPYFVVIISKTRANLMY